MVSLRVSYSEEIMPTYTFVCCKCQYKFELFMTFDNYTDDQKCEKCKAKADRSYADDLSNATGFVRLSDSEIKTLGHLAHRNSEKMSADQKQALYAKHNAYKEEKNGGELPTGMSRMEKGPKTIWPK